ncbi:hypothetical protein Hamer_G002225, partial [Homarus americanus]
MVPYHREGGGYWWILLLVMTLVVVVTEAGQGVLYLVGEANKRGTNLITSWVAASLSVCCLVCHKRVVSSETQCVGFNWVSSSRMCQTLSSLRNVVEDTTCNLYVPDSPSTSVELKFKCENCHGESTPAGLDSWVHQCEPWEESVVVGVAAFSSLSDLDYLLCKTFPGLMLDKTFAAAINDDRNCIDHISKGKTSFVTAAWADDQFFNNPKTFTHQCRGVSSETSAPPSPAASFTGPPSPAASSTEPPSPAASSTEPPSPTASFTEPPSPAASSTEPPSPAASSTEPPSPAASSTEPPSPAASSTEPPHLLPPTEPPHLLPHLLNLLHLLPHLLNLLTCCLIYSPAASLSSPAASSTEPPSPAASSTEPSSPAALSTEPSPAASLNLLHPLPPLLNLPHGLPPLLNLPHLLPPLPNLPHLLPPLLNLPHLLPPLLKLPHLLPHLLNLPHLLPCLLNLHLSFLDLTLTKQLNFILLKYFISLQLY